MFLPLKDINPTERFPFVTIGLIGLNVIVFLYELSLGARLGAFVSAWGATPYEIVRFSDLPGGETRAFPFAPVTLVSSMFIHGGFFHILGNMLYLWIFGNNIEDLLGPTRFLFFYLLCGLAAALTHTMLNPGSLVPTVGASGAVSGVLGAYLIAYPHARVLTLVFVFIFVRLIVLPAGVLLVFWFVIQALSGLTSLGASIGGGIAWFAHIGGFLAGIVLLKLMAGSRLAWRRRWPSDR